jgi:hypothetical protein
MPNLENIPNGEQSNIDEIANLTIKQLERRYSKHPPALRGVHAKDHGCVTAKFKVEEDLPAHLRVGVFASAGREYEALIRFSNAAVSEEPDSKLEKGLAAHGSRGMAIKLLGVGGTPLPQAEEPLTQDFLLINQPVFAFANVEDYLALSEILRDTDDPVAFVSAFMARAKETENGKRTPKAVRAAKTLGIIGRIRSSAMVATPPPAGSPPTGAYQTPPGSPLDNQYFSAAPFLFGEVVEPLDIADSRYLRTAMRKRLAPPDAGNVVFKFQVQIRSAQELAGKIDREIEDATFEWEASFSDVATITIPAQDFETAERRALCESLTFSPWHRLRRPVYETSSHRRGAGGCPMSVIS